MSHISRSAAHARETARRGNGEFGEQHHTGPEMTLGAGLDLSSHTPVDIDAKLAEIYQERAIIAAQLQWREKEAERARAAADKAETEGERYEGQLAYLTRVAEEAEATVAQIADDIRAKNREADPYEAEYRSRGGWSRAFLTTSANGHVHSSTSCSTCNRDGKATSFAWMTDYSGADEETIVADAGERACTTCFPSAPVDVLNRPTKMFTPDEKRKQEERAERERAKIEKARKRIENALTADGSEFIVKTGPGEDLTWRNTERFKTERAAVIWATDQVMWSGHTGRDADHDAAIQTIAEAVAAKHGRPVGYVLGEIRVKGDMKAKRITAAEGKKAIAALAEWFKVDS